MTPMETTIPASRRPCDFARTCPCIPKTIFRSREQVVSTARIARMRDCGPRAPEHPFCAMELIRCAAPPGKRTVPTCPVLPFAIALIPALSGKRDKFRGQSGKRG